MNRLRFWRSLRLTVAIILSLFLAMGLGMHNPLWAPTSVLMVEAGTVGEAQMRWWQRIAGTVLGVLWGFFLIWHFVQRPEQLIVLCGLSAFVLAYASLTHFAWQDFWRWVLVGLLVMLCYGILNPMGSFSVMVDRIGCVFIGATTIYVLHILWPLEVGRSHQEQQQALLRSLQGWLDASTEALPGHFFGLLGQLRMLRFRLSRNYGDYHVLHDPQRKAIGSLYGVELLARHLYAWRVKCPQPEPAELEWVRALIASLSEGAVLPAPPSALRSGSLLSLMQQDAQQLQAGHSCSKSMLRWQWQNRLFQAGTDSPLLSALVIGGVCAASLQIWHYTGWPGGNLVVLLATVSLLMSQYAEKVPTRLFMLPLFIGSLVLFPIFVFVLPQLGSDDALIIMLVAVYLPLAWLLHGSNRTLAVVGSLMSVMINSGSSNYIPSELYVQRFFVMCWACLGVGLLFPVAQHILLPDDTEQRLRNHFAVWQREWRHWMLQPYQTDMTRKAAQMERRTDIILALYGRLPKNKQANWQAKLAQLPLLMATCQQWSYSKRTESVTAHRQ
ncbi:FUSC family protein [Plesiomonas shigelloides]|uniref:FUSC family protein n=1 Tax=Plesiomonas shigelloides TaxID=703 RepID=UPI00387F0756